MQTVFAVATITATNITTGNAGLDISAAAMATYRKLRIRVHHCYATSGSGAKKAVLAVQWVAAADFTTPIGGPAINLSLNLPVADKRFVDYEFSAAQLPTLPVGTANGKVRVACTNIDSNASLRYEAWLEGV